jgi:voltage-gated potassium channel
VSLPKLRKSLYAQLDPTARPYGLSLINRIVCTLIVLSSLFAILETEPSIAKGHRHLLGDLETGFAMLFLFEYVARVWASAEDPKFGPGLMGRIRYMISPPAIVDLIALAPVLFAFGVSEVFLVRAFRFIRILRLARLGRFSNALHYIGKAIAARRDELLIALSFGLLLMVVSSTLLYLTEGAIQPKAFGSIPRAMWWSVATVTTVGYGDVYPVTPLGRAFAAITAITSIGLIAMPAGILAAAFSEAWQHRQAAKDSLRRPGDPPLDG